MKKKFAENNIKGTIHSAGFEPYHEGQHPDPRSVSTAGKHDIDISSKVARPLLDSRPDLVSLGQYRLRGVTERQELFTLD